MTYCDINEAWNTPLQKQINDIQVKYDQMVQQNKGNVIPPWSGSVEPFEELTQKYNVQESEKRTDPRVAGRHLMPADCAARRDVTDRMLTKKLDDPYTRGHINRDGSSIYSGMDPLETDDSSLPQKKKKRKTKKKKRTKKTKKEPFMYLYDSTCGSDCQTDITSNTSSYNVTCPDVELHLAHCRVCQAKFLKKDKKKEGIDYKDIIMCIMGGALVVLLVDLFISKKVK
jgi:hypothetical protein